MPAAELPDELRRSSTHVLVGDPAELATSSLVVDRDVEHHLTRVLRLASGESVTATDGAGGWRCYSAVVESGSIVLEATSDLRHAEPAQRRLTIATAIPKGDRVDWLVQKCTELGVDRIVFLHADRSVVRWKPARATKQLDRLQRIADEALRQCRRVWRVDVDGPVDALTVLPGAVVAEPGGRALTSADSVIAIGPEGGWSDDELRAAAGRIDLGPRILRTETAAISATILSQ